MNDKNSIISKKNIKFSPLEMDDPFVDGDHSHDDFNYRSQVRTEGVDDAKLIANSTSNDNTASIGGDPHAHGLGGDLKSAVVGIVKGMVGPAILYLPHGFAQAGWLIAVPMLFASTALYLASSSSLLECWEVETKRNKRLLQLEGSNGNIGDSHSSLLEMKELRKKGSFRSNIDSNVVESTTTEGFENEFLEGTPAIRTPSYPDLARKAFGPRGQTLVEIGIAASECLQCMLCNTDVIGKTKSYQ